LPYNIIWAVAIDASGNKWVGTMGTGTNGALAKFDGSTWTSYTPTNSGLPNYYIHAIAIDASGTKWIGTSNGLASFNTSWKVYTTANSGLPDNYVYSIAIDANGTKWIGTSTGGLAKFDGSTWTVYNKANSGLPNNMVMSIAIDANQNKWIGTYYGGLAYFHDNSGIRMYPGSAQYPLMPLCRNFPNPFRQKTYISYNVQCNGPVCLRIYSPEGQLVQTLVNTRQEAGRYAVAWDGKNDKGKIMSRGVYLYQLISNGTVISGKMNFVE
jgi:hypothetical protein